MQALAVELRLLNEIGGPDLRLNPGRGLMARVVSADGHGRGTLNIAGALLEAELPRHLRTGDQVRLVVRALDEHRVVLELPKAAQPAPEALPPPVALPGEARLQVLPDPEPEPGSPPRDPRSSVVALSYETPALGPLELRFELNANALRVSVAAGAAGALELARTHAGQLREALAQATGRPVSVTVGARRDPLDLYA